MKDEILEELWKIKDQVAKEYGFDVEKLGKEMQKREKETKGSIVDLTLQAELVAHES